jgi:FkbM family methyltransferase
MLLDFNSIVRKYNMKISGVLHIGAHYGEEHSLYKMNNINKIVYFEPLKNNFQVLESKVGGDATLYNIALGQEEKEIEMFVETANNGQSSSILEPVLHLVQYPGILFNDRETVQMKRLDDVIDNSNSEYNFINIDVQGYELEVFKGSTKTLENIDYIIAEINRDEVYKNCAKVNELCEFLGQYGFDLVEENWVDYGKGDWGDGLFVKKRN